LDKKKKQESISIEEYLKKRQKIKNEETRKKKKDPENTVVTRFSGAGLFVGGIVGGFLL
jgi:hypothetical protein